MESLGSDRASEYVVDACDAIEFKLNLKINIWYLADTLDTYISHTFAEQVDNALTKHKVQPDNLNELLSTAYPYTVSRSLTDFTALASGKVKFQPFGKLRHSYKKQGRKFEIYFIEDGLSNMSEFLAYHKRMESFLLFFVDGASAIEYDSQWCFYCLYEVLQSGEQDENDPAEDRPNYAFIGYMAIYKFYAYPSSIRPRISQVLILPPYRRMGHASQLLTSLYRDMVNVDSVRDITVEDPSDEFQRLRDIADAQRCLQHPKLPALVTLRFTQSTKEEAAAAIVNTRPSNELNGTASVVVEVTNGNHESEGPPCKQARLTAPDAVGGGRKSAKSSIIKYQEFSDFLRLANQDLKMSRLQAKRVYEILQLHSLPRSSFGQARFRSALRAKVDKTFKQLTPNSQHRVSDNDTRTSNPVRMLVDQAMAQSHDAEIDAQVDATVEAYSAVLSKLDACRS